MGKPMPRKIGKAKNQRTKRALNERAPKLVENTKTALMIKGPKSSSIVNEILKDLYVLKKPESKHFTKRNLTRPFEDQSSVEFLSQANDASLFCYGSHSKKRPNNIVLGRLFDYQMLDMIELAIDMKTFKSMKDFPTRKNMLRIGSKPMFVFAGEEFENNPDFSLAKNLILDFFRGDVLDKINLAGLDRVIVCTAVKDKIHFRHYGIGLKKSGSKYPKVELELAGPSIDFGIRRTVTAPPSVRANALRKPKKMASKKRKNMERGLLGDKMGRVHMEKQNLQELDLARMKGLGKRRRVSNARRESEMEARQKDK